jgi:HTH-type transcriptional regulator/antitoxin HigA
MKKTHKKLHFANLPKNYRLLCEIHLPRPIHDRISYENALEVIEPMAGFDEQFTPDQSDYFDLLVDLISAYEEQHEKTFPAGKTPPRERLAYLLENAGWSASDLGRFLGLDATMGNKILRGERKLTAEHIRKLSRHFSLAAEYFL